MKTAALIGFLTLVFLVVFVFRIEEKVIGPTTADEVDDLKIAKAYFDRRDDSLVLITPDQWARLPLQAVARANSNLSNIRPIEGNILHWTALSPGQPPQELTQSLEPVAVATDQYASLEYNHYPPDGRARRSTEETVSPPTGFDKALFLSHAEDLPGSSKWLKSYLLVTSSPGQDGNYGTRFFYSPDYRRTLAWAPSYLLTMFGPTFLALCIALPVTFGNLRALASSIWFVVAFLLSFLSFISLLIFVGFAEAWNGQGSGHFAPQFFLGASVIILLIFVAIRVVRSRSFRSAAKEATRISIPDKKSTDY
ncbi:hypothetical protein BH09VER1_BH09VER1_03110 [soil metagenome]